MTDWLGDPPRTLDELEAFDTMVAFLEAFWERGDKASDDLALLLTMLTRDLWKNGMPGDPAMWSDWRQAVDTVLGKSR